MPRRDGHKKFYERANREQHARRRTTRGGRTRSKLIKQEVRSGVLRST